MREKEPLGVDVGWDYPGNSIKKSTERKGGKRVRRKGGSPTKGQAKLARFPGDPTKKVELFPFLSEKLYPLPFPDGKQSLQIWACVCSGMTTRCPPCDPKRRKTRIVAITRCPRDGCPMLDATVDTEFLSSSSELSLLASNIHRAPHLGAFGMAQELPFHTKCHL
ncbi:hypothetical protein GWK47_035014 [Chionoecetes opilio]|uniref:Uncharacterized protein n=1 Tax=Chionoecetes opilio TaxID=41210 RepID=A0A8J4YNJ0_CHIOP|nr:hypothetical protein GWK47_035014 [Chionoecetes opilio]